MFRFPTTLPESFSCTVLKHKLSHTSADWSRQYKSPRSRVGRHSPFPRNIAYLLRLRRGIWVGTYSRDRGISKVNPYRSVQDDSREHRLFLFWGKSTAQVFSLSAWLQGSNLVRGEGKAPAGGAKTEKERKRQTRFSGRGRGVCRDELLLLQRPQKQLP